MKTYSRLILDVIIIAVLASVLVFLYQNYGRAFVDGFFDSSKIGISIRDTSLTVEVVDDQASRTQGLSGVAKMPADEGMLFFFDREGYYSFWMKDMNFPIDIFWIDNSLRVVHIEKNVRPETYPARYTSSQPARFVLETNAFFAETFGITVGDMMSIPAHRLPFDLRP